MLLLFLGKFMLIHLFVVNINKKQIKAKTNKHSLLKTSGHCLIFSNYSTVKMYAINDLVRVKVYL